MSAPPEDISPSELWVQLTQMPRPHRVVDFPRKDPVTGLPAGQVAIWPLTQEESMICQKAAETFARKSLKENLPKKDDAQEGYLNLYRNAAAVEVLARACRRVEDLKRPAFPSPELMRKQFTHDEIGVLTSYYHRVQSELGPYVTDFTTEELDAWVKMLEEGGSAYFLDLLASDAKDSLIMHLVSQLQSYSTDSGSLGEPQETSTNESSTPSESDGLEDGDSDGLDDEAA
jgi:hypothetical protein